MTALEELCRAAYIRGFLEHGGSAALLPFLLCYRK